MKNFIMIFVVLIVGYSIYCLSTHNYDPDEEVLNAIFAWTRIKELPEWNYDKKIKVIGNPLTRELKVTFSGTKEQINDWLNSEPVFNIAKKEILSDYRIKYILLPQAGSQYAEVIIDNSTGLIIIRTNWS